MEEYIENLTPVSEEENNPEEKKDDLVEMVRQKHSESAANVKSERLSDVLVMQIGVCIMLLILLAVISLVDSSAVRSAVSEFRRMTNLETEEIYRRAAEVISSYIK